MTAMDPAATPVERLAQSRERLRLALSGLPPAPDDPQTPRQAARSERPWWVHLVASPGAGIVVEAVQTWWARHPMRINVVLAIDATQAVMRPVARRHPVALVGVAFVIGGLYGWHRPWQGHLRRTLFAGLLPQLLISSLAAQARRTTTSAAQTNGP